LWASRIISPCRLTAAARPDKAAYVFTRHRFCALLCRTVPGRLGSVRYCVGYGLGDSLYDDERSRQNHYSHMAGRLTLRYRRGAFTGAAMMVMCAAVMAVIAAALSAPLPSLTPLSAAMVAGLGAGSTGIATILFLFVIRESGPGTIAKINYFPPVVSVTAGIILLGEDFSPKVIIAFAVIVCGLLIARRQN